MTSSRPVLTVAALVGVLSLGTAGGAVAGALVTSADIKDGTIQVRDVSAAAKKALTGQRGPRGLRGVRGLRGLRGASGPVDVRYALPNGGVTDGTGEFTFTAVCPDGLSVVGGGHQIFGNPGQLQLVASRPVDTDADSDFITDNGWAVTVESTTSQFGTVFPSAVCASTTSVAVAD